MGLGEDRDSGQGILQPTFMNLSFLICRVGLIHSADLSELLEPNKVYKRALQTSNATS